jgi:hypothetical protein
MCKRRVGGGRFFDREMSGGSASLFKKTISLSARSSARSFRHREVLFVEMVSESVCSVAPLHGSSLSFISFPLFVVFVASRVSCCPLSVYIDSTTDCTFLLP